MRSLQPSAVTPRGSREVLRKATGPVLPSAAARAAIVARAERGTCGLPGRRARSLGPAAPAARIRSPSNARRAPESCARASRTGAPLRCTTRCGVTSRGRPSSASLSQRSRFSAMASDARAARRRARTPRRGTPSSRSRRSRRRRRRARARSTSHTASSAATSTVYRPTRGPPPLHPRSRAAPRDRPASRSGNRSARRGRGAPPCRTR